MIEKMSFIQLKQAEDFMIKNGLEDCTIKLEKITLEEVSKKIEEITKRQKKEFIKACINEFKTIK